MLIQKTRLELDRVQFDSAVRAEVDSLWMNGIWTLVNLPPGVKVKGAHMPCERKRGADGTVSRNKGRCVARGDTQVYQLDHNDVWAPWRDTPRCVQCWW